MLRVVGIMLVLLSASQPVFALEAEEVSAIGVSEQVGQQVPLSITFTTETDAVVSLSELITGDIPVVLIPVYYQCPRICTLVLDGVQQTLQRLSGKRLGKDFRIVTFSIGPEDRLSDVQKVAKRQRGKLGKSLHNDQAWHFLRGSKSSIAALTSSIGYRYQKDGDDYAHPAALVVLRPDGVVNRYLYGMTFEPHEWQLAVAEAASGTISATDVADRVLLYCYKYDPDAKGYVLVARNVMKLGGYVTLVFVVGFLGSMWIWDRSTRKRKKVV